MKSTMKFLVLIFGVLMLSNVAYAESPREQLQQMGEQLQKNPADNALREKIIRLAQEIKPAPAIPEEAERRMRRGTAAFKGAKSVADYRDAAKEFEQATLAAPWYGDAYFNLGVAQDKAENYEAALRSLKFAQLASPEVKEIKALIYEVEYRNEKANSAVAAVEQEKKAMKEFLVGFWQEDSERNMQINGTWSRWKTKEGDPMREVIKIRKYRNNSYEIAHLDVPHWNPEKVRIGNEGQAGEWWLQLKGCDTSTCGIKVSCRKTGDDELMCVHEGAGAGNEFVRERRYNRRGNCETIGDRGGFKVLQCN